MKFLLNCLALALTFGSAWASYDMRLENEYYEDATVTLDCGDKDAGTQLPESACKLLTSHIEARTTRDFMQLNQDIGIKSGVVYPIKVTLSYQGGLKVVYRFNITGVWSSSELSDLRVTKDKSDIKKLLPETGSLIEGNMENNISFSHDGASDLSVFAKSNVNFSLHKVSGLTLGVKATTDLHCPLEPTNSMLEAAWERATAKTENQALIGK
ncbi:hypothetical protein [Cysteiniphilum sp. 6C5]|uniref:hypothetical protein n=1 Tax=unclassified Cysteiniphilum TaxID=2610889 RepID=UPI003F87482B